MATHPPMVLPIRFFKAILKSNLQRIKIPDKFTNIYGGMLWNPVFLRPPDGTEWKVHWTEQNGEIWFEKGWKEFAENNSLDHGHFVFFTFDGTSKIDVLILHQSFHDPSPHTSEQRESPDHSDDEEEEPDSDQNQIVKCINLFYFHRNLSLNWPRNARARELAKKFISCNPFFTVLIRHYNLTEHRLNLPNLKGYIDKGKKYVTVEVGGKSWSLKLVRYSDRMRMGLGWRTFARENGLEGGDVCIFELIFRNDHVFKVHIFKRQS
ncbi:hypothetical protein DEO72_LG9g3727 [Vigna unguiculata]|uniref:TF-B3 domain-containing protein n=1 Tax=Vigna unguiculata TaxID=3917 RepID=A0A4D6N5X0_VIGUN|nr:hypothetical protein DEO72_LG9g3727 [Vigna unguiculata]